MYLPKSQTVIISRDISSLEKALEGANGIKIRNVAKKMTDVDVKAPEDTSV